jgi:hypothetical protein
MAHILRGWDDIGCGELWRAMASYARGRRGGEPAWGQRGRVGAARAAAAPAARLWGCICSLELVCQGSCNCVWVDGQQVTLPVWDEVQAQTTWRPRHRCGGCGRAGATGAATTGSEAQQAAGAGGSPAPAPRLSLLSRARLCAADGSHSSAGEIICWHHALGSARADDSILQSTRV